MSPSAYFQNNDCKLQTLAWGRLYLHVSVPPHPHHRQASAHRTHLRVLQATFFSKIVTARIRILGLSKFELTFLKFLFSIACDIAYVWICMSVLVSTFFASSLRCQWPGFWIQSQLLHVWAICWGPGWEEPRLASLGKTSPKHSDSDGPVRKKRQNSAVIHCETHQFPIFIVKNMADG